MGLTGITGFSGCTFRCIAFYAIFKIDWDHYFFRVDKKEYIFDMIQVLGGRKNPHQLWARIVETHPEVVGKCDNLQFPGAGQRETPVARTKEDAYYILGLLPGAVGNKYRKQAANAA